jgi:lipopolysaccharide/colanic/teichoic acid biosynthesis glycosyltransferase
MKRLFDLALILLCSPLLLPILVVVAMLVRLKLGAPLFFRQKRPGLDGGTFEMIKFRSMTNERDKDGHLLPDTIRLTEFGKFLRSTSLDEFPGLWCVLKGEMSLVGPRPLLIEYLPLYSIRQARRHEARPGITGWAQVSGRNTLSWEEKFNLDVWYVDNQSIWLDIKILWLTIKRVIVRDGISANGEATMTKFEGSQK